MQSHIGCCYFYIIPSKIYGCLIFTPCPGASFGLERFTPCPGGYLHGGPATKSGPFAPCPPTLLPPRHAAGLERSEGRNLLGRKASGLAYYILSDSESFQFPCCIFLSFLDPFFLAILPGGSQAALLVQAGHEFCKILHLMLLRHFRKATQFEQFLQAPALTGRRTKVILNEVKNL